jgi:S1-C subfamily serine protease
VLNEELAKQYGWEDEYDEVKNLLVVTEVDPIGEAQAQGLRPGDLIISVQGKEVRSVAALKQALSEEILAEGARLRARTTAGYRTFFLQVEK